MGMAQRRTSNKKTSSSKRKKSATTKNSEKKSKSNINTSLNENNASGKPVVNIVFEHSNYDSVGTKIKNLDVEVINNNHRITSEPHFMEMLFDAEGEKNDDHHSPVRNQNFMSVANPHIPLLSSQELVPEPECRQLFEMTFNIVKEEPLDCGGDFDQMNLYAPDFPQKWTTELLLADQIKTELPYDDNPPDMLSPDEKNNKCSEVTVFGDKFEAGLSQTKIIIDLTDVDAKIPVIGSSTEKDFSDGLGTKTPSKDFYTKINCRDECTKPELKKTEDSEDTWRSNQNRLWLCQTSHSSSPTHSVSISEYDSDTDVSVCYMNVKRKPSCDLKSCNSQAPNKMIQNAVQPISSTINESQLATDDSDICTVVPSLKVKEEPLSDSENCDISGYTESKEFAAIRGDSSEDGSLFVTSASKEYGKARRITPDQISSSPNNTTCSKEATVMQLPSKNLSHDESVLSSKTSEKINLSDSIRNKVVGSLTVNLYEEIRRTALSSLVDIESDHEQKIAETKAGELLDKTSVSNKQICDNRKGTKVLHTKSRGRPVNRDNVKKFSKSSNVPESSQCHKTSFSESLCDTITENAVLSGGKTNANFLVSVSGCNNLCVPDSGSSRTGLCNSQNTEINHTSVLNNKTTAAADNIQFHPNLNAGVVSKCNMSTTDDLFSLEIASSHVLSKSENVATNRENKQTQWVADSGKDKQLQMNDSCTTTEMVLQEKQPYVAASCGGTSFVLPEAKFNSSAEFSDKHNHLGTEAYRKQVGSNFSRRTTTIKAGKTLSDSKCEVNNLNGNSSQEVLSCDEVSGDGEDNVLKKRSLETSVHQESKKLKSTLEGYLDQPKQVAEVCHEKDSFHTLGNKAQVSNAAKNVEVSAPSKHDIPLMECRAKSKSCNMAKNDQLQNSSRKEQSLLSIETGFPNQGISQLKQQNILCSAVDNERFPHVGGSTVSLTKDKVVHNKVKAKQKWKRSAAKETNVQITLSKTQNVHFVNEINKSEMLTHNGQGNHTPGNWNPYHYHAPAAGYHSYPSSNMGSHFNPGNNFIGNHPNWNCQNAGNFGNMIFNNSQFQQMMGVSVNMHNNNHVGQTAFQTNNHGMWSNNIWLSPLNQGCFNVPQQPMYNLQNFNVNQKTSLPPPNIQSPLLPPPNIQSPLLPPPNIQSPLLPPPNNRSPLLPPPNNRSPLLPPPNVAPNSLPVSPLQNYPNGMHNVPEHCLQNLPFMSQQPNSVSPHSAPLISYTGLQDQQYSQFPSMPVMPSVSMACPVSKTSLSHGCMSHLKDSSAVSTLSSLLSQSSPELEVIPQPPLPSNPPSNPPPLPPSPPPLPPASPPPPYFLNENPTVTLSNTAISPASSPLPPLEPLYGTSVPPPVVTNNISDEFASLSGAKQNCSQILEAASELQVSFCASLNFNVSTRKTHSISVEHSVSHVHDSSVERVPESNLVFSLEPFLSHILSWNVKWLKEQIYAIEPPPVSEKVKKVGFVYVSYKDYYDTYFPLLLLETWDTIFLSWRQEKVNYFYSVKNSNALGRFLEIQCDTIVSRRTLAEGKYPAEGYLIIIYFGPQNLTDDCAKVFGYVTHHNVNPFVIDSDPQNPCLKHLNRQNGDDLCVLSMTTRISYRLARTFDLSNLLRIEVVHSLKRILKQYEALLNLHISPLCMSILSPSNELCKVVSLSKMHSYMEKKISTIAIVKHISDLIVRDSVPQVMVVKALPGTDKVNTLVQLIQYLKSLETNERKTRVLLCSRTDEAVDKIGCHLIFSQENDKDKQVYCVRLGELSDIHPRVRRFSFCELLTQEVARIKSQEQDLLDIEYQEAVIKYAETEARQKRLLALQPKWAELLKTQLAIEQAALVAKQKAKEKVSSQHKKRHKMYVSLAESSIIKECDVILSTVANCHQAQVDKICDQNSTMRLGCCIIDDASQCTELETLIPLLYGIKKIILLGDPNIMAKTVSKIALESGYNLSYFKRVFNQVSISEVYDQS